MQVKIDKTRRARQTLAGWQATSHGQDGFTLVEVVVASALVGIMLLAFMGSFSTSFQNVQVDREYSRATQILLEKTELLRLYNWDQITGNDTNAFIPMTFTSPFYPYTNGGGFDYSGSVTINNAPISEAYSNDMRYVTISVSWASGGVQRSRTMSSYVSRYGLQNYIY
jgi:prepilin-type N-terminal cleavage/methylation domain-containing protein